MKTALIINPSAGRGRKIKHLPTIRALLKQNKIDVEENMTEYPGHATEIARKIQDRGFNRIIIVGGDGTLNEAINGLDLKKAVLGVIPIGTGNDFCRTLGIPTDYEEAVKIIARDKISALDLGKVNDRFFANIAGVGFDAQVADETNNNFHWLSGMPAYLMSVFKLLFTYKNLPLKVQIDGHINLNINSFLLAVGNAKYYGAGMQMVPSALLDDGFFHVCVAGDIKKFQALFLLPKVFSGKHIGYYNIKEYKAKKVEISSPVASIIYADGEIIGSLPARFEIAPKVLKFLTK